MTNEQNYNNHKYTVKLNISQISSVSNVCGICLVLVCVQLFYTDNFVVNSSLVECMVPQNLAMFSSIQGMNSDTYDI